MRTDADADNRHALQKRSVTISGHRTSISLEGAFWSALKEIAAERDLSLTQLIRSVDAERKGSNLSSALRVFTLEWLQANASPPTAF